MKIAIADRKGSYSDYWITYCEENNIPFIRVNPYVSDIIDQVKDCDAFMWRHHTSYRDTRLVKCENTPTQCPQVKYDAINLAVAHDYLRDMTKRSKYC